jgi:starvation-inducible DNA-binding protein
MSKTSNYLQQVLSDSYGALLQTQRFHWNVEGADFYAYHKLAEAIYDEQFEAIDVIAERIRAKGVKVVISQATLAKEIKLTFGDKPADLLKAQEVVANSLKKLIDIADDEDDDVTEDMAIQRLAVHEKNIWMIKAQMKK